MKRTNKAICLLLALLMLVPSFGQISVQAADTYENIAKDKPVTATSSIGEHLPELAVDGIKTSESSWATDAISENPSLTVNLGAEEKIAQIALTWNEDFAFKYRVFTAGSNEQYSLLVFHEKGTGGEEIWDVSEDHAAVQYVKIELVEAKGGEDSIGLQELEVLQKKEDTPAQPENLALNKPAYASGNEAGLDRLGPAGAFDGKWSDDYDERWSSGNITQSPQWIYVDLEEATTFSCIRIYWQEAYATAYELQYSNTAEEGSWTSITAVDDGEGGWVTFNFDPITARYVRLYATASNGVGTNKPISVWEMMIHASHYEDISLDDIAEDFTVGTITPDMTKMPSFSFADGRVSAEFFCSDTDDVVNDEGSITQPLVDKDILVTYVLKDKVSGEEKQVMNLEVNIPGQYHPEASDNPAPVTLPSLQEWKGASGKFTLSEESRICVEDDTLMQAALITQADISDLFGMEIEVTKDAARAGDIVLTTEGADPTISEQGYILDIQDQVTVRASAYQGVFFGTRSVLQALLYSGDETIAKGVARDYPKYGIRKFTLDVARKYMPMSYLKDLVRYASWYKMSDIQIHLNDTSYNDHSRFRLESDIEGLTAEDGYYTKDEYRDFQYYAQDYGIRIISEFDTPAHSQVFIDNVDPSLGFDKTHLDIRLDSEDKDKVYQFIADLYDEYLGGDDPVFVTDMFNVGLDEYNSNYKEDMTQYTKYVMELVHDRYGKTPMAWASMGCLDSTQTTLPDYPVMDAWANYAINLKSLFAQGYHLVNATNKYGYVVPGGNNGYPDFPKEEEIYYNMSAGKFIDKNNAGVTVAEGHPQIAGGSATLWNDRGIFNGISVYDVFARTKSIIPLYAQAYWYGQDEDLSYEEFKAEQEILGDGPQVESSHRIESADSMICSFDMNEAKNEEGDSFEISDHSGNGYDARVVQGELSSGTQDRQLVLENDGYIEMRHRSLGWPYTVAFELKINESSDDEIVLFEEQMPREECNETITTGYETRKIYMKRTDGGYQLMFDRDNYHFESDYVFETGKVYKIAFESNQKTSEVFVDGRHEITFSGPVLTNSGNKWYDSGSIYLPLQKVGQGLNGTIDDLMVFDRELDEEEIGEIQDIEIERSVTLNKPVTVSSLDPLSQGKQNGENAVDGDSDTRWTSNRANGYDLNEWIVVDLQGTYTLNRVEIDWEAAAGAVYEVQVSMDGETYTTVAAVNDGKASENRVISFEPTEAAYLKINCTKKVSNRYGYSIWELRAFEAAQVDKGTLAEAIDAAKSIEEEGHTTDSWTALQDALEAAETIMADEDATQEQVDQAASALQSAMDALQVKASASALNALQNMVGKAEALESDDEALNAAIKAAQALLDDPDNTSVTAVVSALLELSEAMQNLNIDESTDALRKDVQATIDFINENILNDVEGLRPGKVEALKDAVKAAQDVVNDPTATADALKAANKAMTKAAQELWEIVSKAELNALIEAANGYLDGNYTAESLEALNAAIEAAQAVSANDDATTAEVTQAITNLSDAIANLEKITLDTRALEHEIELVNEMLANIGNYVPSSVEGLQEKLDAAKNTLTSATTQAEIDEATNSLREARLNARTKADVSALEELIAYVNSLDLRAYTAESADSVLVLTDRVLAKMNDPQITQEEVDALAEELQIAIDALQPVSEENVTTPDDGMALDPTNTAAANMSGMMIALMAAAGVAAIAAYRRKRS